MYQNKFEIIDAHCHIYPEKIAAKAAESVGRFYNEAPACTGTLEELLRLNEAAGIDRTVVQSVATAPKQVASINTFIAAEVEKSNGRLIGFGTMHPESENIEADIDYLISLGLKGFKIHPDIQGFQLDHAGYMKAFEIANERA